MKKILQLTCAILFVNATLSMAQDNTNVNGALKVQGNIFLKASAENSDDGKILFYRNADGWTPAVIKQFWTGLNFQGGLHFQTNTDGLTSLTTKMTILNNGNVGIGTSNPISIFHTKLGTNQNIVFVGNQNGVDTGTSGIISVNDANSAYVPLGFYASKYSFMGGNLLIGSTVNSGEALQVTGNAIITGQLRGSDIVSNGTNSWIFHTPDDGRKNMFIAPGLGSSGGSAGWDWAKGMVLNNDGSVGISANTVPANYKLAVGGDVIAERVVVKLQTNWPDYVFSPTYQKATLPEVEQYILKNSHLPNIPSSQEVAEKGQDIGAMNVKMMEKIEELTLYLIEQNKRLEALEKKNESLENLLKQLKK
jgi:hypothetical protein